MFSRLYQKANRKLLSDAREHNNESQKPWAKPDDSHRKPQGAGEWEQSKATGEANTHKPGDNHPRNG
jgi:hypothetical protein